MTGLLILNAVLCIGIVMVIVGMLASAIIGDRAPATRNLRAAARSRSTAPRVAVPLPAVK